MRLVPALTALAVLSISFAESAHAEPVKQLTHRDRLYDTAGYGGDLYAVGHPGLLMRSHDGGKTFESVRAGQTDEAFFSIAFNAKGQGAVVGRSGVALTTGDGGKSWQKTVVKLDQDAPSLFSVAVLPSGAIVAVGEFGTIVRSEDQGKTWSRSTYSPTVEPPAPGQTVAPCPGAESADHSNDDVMQEARLTDVAFADDKVGFIVAEFGLVLRTTDGGSTFKRQAACTDKILYSVSVISPSHAVAVGADGTALESTDGGITWTLRETSTPEHLYGVYANEKRLIAIGAAGVALVRDASGPFKPIPTGVHGWLSSAYLNDAGQGLIVGGRGYLRRTQDGGNTQQRVFGE